MEANKGANNGFTFNTSKTEESLLTEEPMDFSLPWHFSDVVLVVGDTKFHVHKSTLSMWSPVFETMFTSQFLESSAREIPLPGKHADEVKELLKVIYSSWSKPKVTEENYQSLLQLANEYQMDRVKRLCSEFLVNKIKVSNCLDFFKLAEQFGLDDVTEKCYEEVRYKSSAELEGSEHFNGFEPEFKVDICMMVIKELETTLGECMLTCYDLVQMVYRKVSMKINGGLVGKSSNLDEHIRRHKESSKLKNVSAKAPMRKRSTLSLDIQHDFSLEFQNSCNFCIAEVQQTPWNDSDSYSILKQPIDKLHALLSQYRFRLLRQIKKRKELPRIIKGL